MDTSAPVYRRAYAWVKLVCFWAALRGDDATWLVPRSLKYVAGYGLQGELSRSKSTGPGKKVLSRPIIVSDGAYLGEKDWCTVGLQLWESTDQSRQNFVLLPGSNYNSFRAEGAEPVDRVALTRNLICCCCLGEDEDVDEDEDMSIWKMLNIWAARFWTEHSSRATLPTMARALGVDKAITDKLGCWTSSQTVSDEYIRCGREQITSTQNKVAEVIRQAVLEDSPAKDLFGESWVLEDLKAFLTQRVHEASIKTVDAFILGLCTFERGGVGSVPVMDKIEVRPQSSSSEDEIVAKPSMIPTKGAWVISTSRGTATLHIVGGCFRVPGTHYSKWNAVQDPVPSDKFKRACRGCFKRGYPVVGEAKGTSLSETLCEGMPRELATEETSDSEESSSD